MRCGNYIGQVDATAMFAAIDPDNPGDRTLTWTPRRTALYHVMIDGAEHTATETAEVQDIPQDARDHIQIIETPTHRNDEDLTKVADSALDTVRFAWSESTGTPDHYELFRSTTSGSYTEAAIEVREAGETSYTYKDEALEDDTYYWTLTAFDVAGNDEDSNEVNKTIDGAPNPPSSISVSVAAATLSLVWTGSDSADLDHYNIYRGDPPDFIDTPHATDAASPWSEDVTGVTAHYEYLLRAEDAGGNEEGNLSQMVSVDLVNGVLVARPNTPLVVTAEAIADGEIRIVGQYDAKGETGEATSIRLYVNDGAGGAVDYGTSVGSATLSSQARFEAATVDSSGLSGALTYLCVIRARTDAGIEDTNTTTTSVTTDSAAPSTPTLTAAVI